MPKIVLPPAKARRSWTKPDLQRLPADGAEFGGGSGPDVETQAS